MADCCCKTLESKMHVIIAKCYMAFVKCCVNQNARAVIAKCYMTFVKCYVTPAKRDMIIANYHDIIAKCYTLILTNITRHSKQPCKFGTRCKQLVTTLTRQIQHDVTILLRPCFVSLEAFLLNIS